MTSTERKPDTELVHQPFRRVRHGPEPPYLRSPALANAVREQVDRTTRRYC